MERRRKNGLKHDFEKTMLHLLPFDALEEVGKVLTFGAKKYSENNWKEVKPFKERYLAALLRHIFLWANAEKNDPETGLSHMAHAATNALFLIWGELNGQNIKKTNKR